MSDSIDEDLLAGDELEEGDYDLKVEDENALLDDDNFDVANKSKLSNKNSKNEVTEDVLELEEEVELPDEETEGRGRNPSADIDDLYQSDTEEEKREKFANERTAPPKSTNNIPENLENVGPDKKFIPRNRMGNFRGRNRNGRMNGRGRNQYQNPHRQMNQPFGPPNQHFPGPPPPNPNQFYQNPNPNPPMFKPPMPENIPIRPGEGKKVLINPHFKGAIHVAAHMNWDGPQHRPNMPGFPPNMQDGRPWQGGPPPPQQMDGLPFPNPNSMMNEPPPYPPSHGCPPQKPPVHQRLGNQQQFNSNVPYQNNQFNQPPQYQNPPTQNYPPNFNQPPQYQNQGSYQQPPPNFNASYPPSYQEGNSQFQNYNQQQYPPPPQNAPPPSYQEYSNFQGPPPQDFNRGPSNYNQQQQQQFNQPPPPLRTPDQNWYPAHHSNYADEPKFPRRSAIGSPPKRNFNHPNASNNDLRKKKRLSNNITLCESQPTDNIEKEEKVEQKVKEVKTVTKVQEPEVDPNEDPETRAYRLKIEEQKKMREKILQLKEERRKAALKNAEGAASVEKIVPPIELIKAPDLLQQKPLCENKLKGSNTNVPVKRVVQNVRTVLPEKTVVTQKSAEIKDTENAGLSSFLNNRKVIIKDNTLLDTPIVVVSNLAAGTTDAKLRKLCQTMGEVKNLQMSTKERQATIEFKNVASAHSFFKKYQRFMIDLSVIQVRLEPVSN